MVCMIEKGAWRHRSSGTLPDTEARLSIAADPNDLSVQGMAQIASE
jgi:hypothetical protein